MHILDSFFNYCSHVFEKKGDDLYAVFKAAFNHHANGVKTAGIKAFSGFLVTANKKSFAKVETLIVPFYDVTYHLLVNDKCNTTGLEILADLVEVEPKILKKSFNKLFELLQKVIGVKNL